jgi:hypothetical protein
MSLLARTTVLLRYFPRLVAGCQDKPAVNELAMLITDNLTVAGPGSGRASSILRKRVAKNSTPSRRIGSNQGSVSRFPTQLAI